MFTVTHRVTRYIAYSLTELLRTWQLTYIRLSEIERVALSLPLVPYVLSTLSLYGYDDTTNSLIVANIDGF